MAGLPLRVPLGSSTAWQPYIVCLPTTTVVQVLEVPVIPDRDLDILRSFNGRGQYTLSAYLRLDTSALRDTAYQDFVQEMQIKLDECGSRKECREAIEEDMEIVGLYLKTNGHRQHAALAIFSCASELFWRAYPLSHPVPTKVSVGSKFDLEPLLELTQPQKVA